MLIRPVTTTQGDWQPVRQQWKARRPLSLIFTQIGWQLLPENGGAGFI
jgi:hypothetical protein